LYRDLVVEAKWVQGCKTRGALWIHDGKVQRPHALLTSGNHSSGFFNGSLVVEDVILLEMAAFDLICKLEKAGLDLHSVDRVVGPALGAIELAHAVARGISHHRSRGGRRDMRVGCKSAFTEKEGEGAGKTMVFKKRPIKEWERVLAVEDVLTTGGSVEATISAIEKAGGIPLPFIGLLVNRSGLKEVGGRKLVALIDRAMPMWVPEDCPLCKAGSEAIRAKGENWARLNAEYV